MTISLIFVPLFFAILALLIPSNRLRPWCLPVCSLIHLTLIGTIINNPPAASPDAWIALDAPGRLVAGLSSLLFCLSSFYAVGYLGHRNERPNRVFSACLLSMLAMTSLVAASQHFGLLWVAMEATTLSTAPLIYFNHNRRSIEGTWKYLLVCSVGIALSLLGTFFLAYASLKQGLTPSLLSADLARQAVNLSQPWLHGAFVLLLVGYGTKMGLAPMHTWKPDAYGEAPGLVGGLLAGAMTSCAFLSVLRIYKIASASGAEYPREMLMTLGFVSMGVAGIFVIRQRDFKRMLAYSSVEHMGLLALGVGLGGKAVYGAVFHLVNNGIAKMLLFLTAGNIHRAFGSKLTDNVSGARKRLPVTAWLFLIGFLAATGSPPFSPFRSIFMIVQTAILDNRIIVTALLLAFLLLVFMGMGGTVLPVVLGEPQSSVNENSYRENALTVLPPLTLMALLLVLGVTIPEWLGTLFSDVVQYIGQTT